MDDEPRAPQTDLIDDWLASVTDGTGTDGTAAEGAPASDPGGDAGASMTLLDALSKTPYPVEDPAAAASGADLAAESERPHQRYVLFTVAGASYAVPDACVTEVGRVPKTTPVPLAPAWLRGVTSLRGDVVSVIDLRTFLGLESTSPHTGRLLVVRLLDEDFATGLLVDGVDQIASVPLDAVRPPASPLDGALADFLTGACHVAQRFVAVLDLDRLLRSPEIRQFDDFKDGKHEERSCEARI